MKAEDCRPNRSLRTTVKAYLKKQVTLREQAQKKQAVKQAADQAAATPAVVPAPTQAENTSSTVPNGVPAAPKDEKAPTSGKASGISRSTEHSKPSAEGEIVPTEAQKDVPQPSIEVSIPCPLQQICADAFKRPLKIVYARSPFKNRTEEMPQLRTRPGRSSMAHSSHRIHEPCNLSQRLVETAQGKG